MTNTHTLAWNTLLLFSDYWLLGPRGPPRMETPKRGKIKISSAPRQGHGAERSFLSRR